VIFRNSKQKIIRSEVTEDHQRVKPVYHSILVSSLIPSITVHQAWRPTHNCPTTLYSFSQQNIYSNSVPCEKLMTNNNTTHSSFSSLHWGCFSRSESCFTPESVMLFSLRSSSLRRDGFDLRADLRTAQPPSLIPQDLDLWVWRKHMKHTCLQKYKTNHL